MGEGRDGPDGANSATDAGAVGGCSPERRGDGRTMLRRVALVVVVALVVWSPPAAACIWDSDTLMQGRSRFPTTLERGAVGRDGLAEGRGGERAAGMARRDPVLRSAGSSASSCARASPCARGSARSPTSAGSITVGAASLPSAALSDGADAPASPPACVHGREPLGDLDPDRRRAERPQSAALERQELHRIEADALLDAGEEGRPHT